MQTPNELIEVIIAYNNGSEIQIKQPGSNQWIDCEFFFYEYRIKPQPKTVPMSLETFPKEVVWIRFKTWCLNESAMVTRVEHAGFRTDKGELIDWQKAFEFCEYAIHRGEFKPMSFEATE